MYKDLTSPKGMNAVLVTILDINPVEQTISVKPLPSADNSVTYTLKFAPSGTTVEQIKSTRSTDVYVDTEFSHTPPSVGQSMTEAAISNIDHTNPVESNPPKTTDVGHRLSVYWEGDNEWYEGTLKKFEPGRTDAENPGEYYVVYDDGEESWEPLGTGVMYRWLNPFHFMSKDQEDAAALRSATNERLVKLGLADQPRTLGPQDFPQVGGSGSSRAEPTASSESIGPVENYYVMSIIPPRRDHVISSVHKVTELDGTFYIDDQDIGYRSFESVLQQFRMFIPPAMSHLEIQIRPIRKVAKKKVERGKHRDSGTEVFIVDKDGAITQRVTRRVTEDFTKMFEKIRKSIFDANQNIDEAKSSVGSKRKADRRDEADRRDDAFNRFLDEWKDVIDTHVPSPMRQSPTVTFYIPNDTRLLLETFFILISREDLYYYIRISIIQYLPYGTVHHVFHHFFAVVIAITQPTVLSNIGKMIKFRFTTTPPL